MDPIQAKKEAFKLLKGKVPNLDEVKSLAIDGGSLDRYAARNKALKAATPA